MRVRRPLVLALIVSGRISAMYLPVLLPPAAAAASLSFIVTSTADVSDASPGDGICATSAGDCTLRAAVEEADAQPNGRTITVTVPAGSYSLTLGVLALTHNPVTVNGAGADATIIDAGGISQVMSVAGGADVTLTGLQLTGGSASGAGGGLANAGTTTLTNVTVTGNSAASGADSAPGSPGGGIYNTGTLTLTSSTVSSNYAGGGGLGLIDTGGHGGAGGGIENTGTLTLTSSSVTGNYAGSGGPGEQQVSGDGGSGGGIDSPSGSVTLTSCDVSGNYAGSAGANLTGDGAGNAGDGGGIANGGTLTVTSSMLSSNVGGNGSDGGNGGGIANSGNASVSLSTLSGNTAGVGYLGVSGNGGGIANTGTLNVTTTTFTGNGAGPGAASGNGGNGGGLYNGGGSATVTRDTFSANTSGAGGNAIIVDPGCTRPGVGGDGGGIYSTATLTVTNATVSGNTTGAGGFWQRPCAGQAPSGVGGGFLIAGGATTMGYTTIADNTDGITVLGGTITLTGTIVADNTNTNCSGTVGEGTGYNLDSGTSCAFALASDINATSPLLGALANNGGPNATQALGGGSAAIDAGGGMANGCPAIDQRGVARPQGAACDIGAYESNGSVGGATHALSGHVRYYGSGSPVAAVEIDLSGVTPQVMNTDASGAFVFTGLGETDWTLTPQSQSAVGSAISAFDAVFALQAAVGLRQLSAQQTVACDTSGNGSVSALDAVYMLQYAVGLIQTFPATQPCGSLWAFVPAPASMVTNEQLINPAIVQGTCQHGAMVFPQLMSDASNQDFAAVLVGDCNGNWQPAAGAAPLAELRSAAQVRLARPRRGRGGRVRFPLSVESGEPFQALDSRISYDAAALRLLAVRRMNTTGNTLVAYNASVPGEVRIALASAAPIASGGGPTLALEFEPRRSASARPARLHVRSASVDGRPTAAILGD